MNKNIRQYFEKISKKCKIKNSEKFDVLVVDPPWNQGKTGYRGVRPNQTKKLDCKIVFIKITNIVSCIILKNNLITIYKKNFF